jgi:hypothetical protein
VPKLVAKAPSFKETLVSSGVTNLFYDQHKVTDATGVIPLRYQSGYLDPPERELNIELFKQY